MIHTQGDHWKSREPNRHVSACWKAGPASPLGQLAVLQGKMTLQNLVLHGRAVGSFRDLMWGKENWKADPSCMEKHKLGPQSKAFPCLKFNCWSFCAGISMWWNLAFRLQYLFLTMTIGQTANGLRLVQKPQDERNRRKLAVVILLVAAGWPKLLACCSVFCLALKKQLTLLSKS